jgi:hypothetical protein
VRSGSGVWTFASNWHGFLSLSFFRPFLLGLSKHRPLVCTWPTNHFSRSAFQPIPIFPSTPFLITSYLSLTLFIGRLASCCHYCLILILTLPVRLPDFSLYTPFQSDFPLFPYFPHQVSVWPLLAFVYLRFDLFFTVHSFVCFFLGLALICRSVQGSIHGVNI